MSTISDRANTDDRLEQVSMADERSQVLMRFEVAPLLATPAVAVGVFGTALAMEEAADN